MTEVHPGDVTDTLGDALRARRAEKGNQSQEVAAAEMGTSQSNVARWENGSDPESIWYQGLQAYLGVDRATLGLLILNQREDQDRRQRRPRGR